MFTQKPLSEYYKDGEKEFFLEIIREIDQASEEGIKGNFDRHKDISYAMFKSKHDVELKFLIILNCCQGTSVGIIIRGFGNLQNTLNIKLNVDMEHLTVKTVLDPLLKFLSTQ